MKKIEKISYNLGFIIGLIFLIIGVLFLLFDIELGGTQFLYSEGNLNSTFTENMVLGGMHMIKIGLLIILITLISLKWKHNFIENKIRENYNEKIEYIDKSIDYGKNNQVNDFKSYDILKDKQD